MIQKACNEFVLILREKTESEKSGMIIPNVGRVKPHVGTIHAIGALVKDPNIKAGKNKKCLFHAGVGFEIEYEGVTYLVLAGHEIIGMP